MYMGKINATVHVMDQLDSMQMLIENASYVLILVTNAQAPVIYVLIVMFPKTEFSVEAVAYATQLDIMMMDPA